MKTYIRLIIAIVLNKEVVAFLIGAVPMALHIAIDLSLWIGFPSMLVIGGLINYAVFKLSIGLPNELIKF